MKERPILMSAPMVCAVLDGSKRQTRRTMKPQPIFWGGGSCWYPEDMAKNARHYADENHFSKGAAQDFSPYGQPGDRLWVRENGWERPERTPKMMREGADTWEPYYFDADGWADTEHEQFKEWGFKRRPSIHMPRWASRILLEIVSVRVERLQDISEEDAKAEGLKGITKDGKLVKYGIPDRDGYPGTDNTGWPWDQWCVSPVDAYRKLWESLNGPGSWNANPWVWVIEFKVVKA